MGLGIECSVRVATCFRARRPPRVRFSKRLIKTSDTAETLRVFDGKMLWIGGRRAESRFVGHLPTAWAGRRPQ